METKKKIHSLLWMLKINHLTEKWNMRLFLAQWTVWLQQFFFFLINYFNSRRDGFFSQFYSALTYYVFCVLSRRRVSYSITNT
jgi:hypothetical protein